MGGIHRRKKKPSSPEGCSAFIYLFIFFSPNQFWGCCSELLSRADQRMSDSPASLSTRAQPQIPAPACVGFGGAGEGGGGGEAGRHLTVSFHPDLPQIVQPVQDASRRPGVGRGHRREAMCSLQKAAWLWQDLDSVGLGAFLVLGWVGGMASPPPHCRRTCSQWKHAFFFGELGLYL